MGFMDSIKEALGGEPDDQQPPPAPRQEAEPRHVDRDAREESTYGPQVTGGKHRA
jgi:hypothetical protein